MALETIDFLSNKELTLEDIAEKYPDEWDKVQKEVCKILASREAKTISSYAIKSKKHAEIWKERIRKSGNNPKVLKTATPHLIRCRLSHLALNKYFDALTQKKTKSKSQNIISSIYYILIFKRYFTKKRFDVPPINLRTHRYLWKFVKNKESILGKAYREGVYCVFSKQLIEGLSNILDGEETLEIAAGDGALTSFLRKKCKIRATDDHSWKKKIEYDHSVEKIDAIAALDKYKPSAVISCFPPAPNGFEKKVFTCESVNLYIVIGSRHDYASGDFKTYSTQEYFSWETSIELTNSVFPREIDPCIYIFRRIEPKP